MQKLFRLQYLKVTVFIVFSISKVIKAFIVLIYVANVLFPVKLFHV